MFLVYKPDGQDAQRWEFYPEKIRSQEAEALEKRTGWDYAEFGQHLLQGSMLARRALLWTYLRRVHHTLRFEDVDFAAGEVELSFNKDELNKIRENVADEPASAERDAKLKAIDDQIEQAPEAEGKAG